ncbi:unnamed protein product [Lactuca virosa]|uniref:Fe2OG dioxygenase domain-containing protein n=1 Tax=Lactuca virosa TaxID=75947 RepID=A0AAU9N7Z3_9ASTR|nr:unnamed protein product [Lactuca virosa]
MVVATQVNPIRMEKIREVDIPVIDLSCSRSKVAKLIVKACEEYGFFKVINHGVSHHITKEMEDESFEFFDKPLPEKELVGSANPFGYGSKNIGLSGDTGELEYLLLPTNQNAIAQTSKFSYAWASLTKTHKGYHLSKALSIKNFNNNSQCRLTLWVTMCVVSSYVKSVRELACEILELIAEGLGVPHSLFSHFVRHFDSDSLLRLNHYPPVTHSFHHGNIGFGEHSDPQIITLLRSNDAPGLQISLRNGLWLPVSPDPHAFCVNIGDILQAMTNGRFVSVRHRAMANLLPNQSRLSMVFFGAPPPEATIACPPQLLKRNKPIYKTFTWSEYKSHTYAHRLGETRLDHFKIT